MPVSPATDEEKVSTPGELFLWRWSVVGWGAGVLFGWGVGEVLSHEFVTAGILFTVAATWTAWKLMREESLSLALVCVGLYLGMMVWVQVHIDADENSKRPPIRAPGIDWATPPAIDFGTPLSQKQLNATASVDGKPIPGKFVYTPASGTTLPVGSDTLSVIFYPDDADKYSQRTSAVVISVRPKANAIGGHRDTPLRTPAPDGPNNAQLADRANDIAARFRDLQDSINWYFMMKRRENGGAIPIDFYQAQWSRIRPISAEAVALERQIVPRLPQQPENSRVNSVLQYGDTAGINPLYDVASYFEDLARQLQLK
jgi:hypothetical protein